MIRLMKQMIFSMAVGFIVPTVAFALTEAPEETAITKTVTQYVFQTSYEDAESAIGFALAEKGAGQKIGATIMGRKNDPVFSYNKPISVEIRGLQFDKNASRWNASLLAVAEGEVITAVPVAGRYEELLEVPVLKKQIRNGETIQQTDIEIRDFPVSQTRGETITDMASLIGKSPARVISAFRPIREQEILMPAAVKKSALVSMRYLSPGMEITATGQAMDDGARGDVIAVRNLASKKIVRAVVEDATTVNILNSNMQSSQLTGVSSHETN